MILPERLYYPLPDAARKLDCTVQDIIHFGAIGAINISVYIGNHKEKNNNSFHLNMPSDLILNIDDFGNIYGDGWYIYNIEERHANDELNLDGYFSNGIDGFFYINNFDLTKIEFDATCKLELTQVSTGSESGYNGCIDVNFLTAPLSIDRSFLCIKKDDIYNFKESISIHRKGQSLLTESPKTIATKSELIPALLKLIPEFDDVDLCTAPIAKITDLVEAIAAKRGVVIPHIHNQTWQAYLGRVRKNKGK